MRVKCEANEIEIVIFNIKHVRYKNFVNTKHLSQYKKHVGKDLTLTFEQNVHKEIILQSLIFRKSFTIKN